jgi:hypothetical protein
MAVMPRNSRCQLSSSDSGMGTAFCNRTMTAPKPSASANGRVPVSASSSTIPSA